MSYDIKLRTVMHCGWKFEIQCCTFIVYNSRYLFNCISRLHGLLHNTALFTSFFSHTLVL